MTVRRAAGARVEDRWRDRNGLPTTRDGQGLRWLARWTDTKGATATKSFTRKVDAQRFVDGLTASLVIGTYVRPSDGERTIGELAPDWWARQGHLKPSAARPVESALRVHVLPRWSDTRIGDIQKPDVKAWLSELGSRRSATITIRSFGILAGILDDAVDSHWLPVNPCRGKVRLPRKGTRRKVYLTHGQVDLLAEECGRSQRAADAVQNETMIYVLAYCGIRFAELAGLRVWAIDFLRRRLTIRENAVTVGGRIEVGSTKNGKERTVPVPRFLLPMLAEQCRGRDLEGLAFPGPDGRHQLLPYGVDGWFAGAVTRSGLPRITPHDLRHTAASLAVQAGANVKAVQRMLGHESAAMTLDIYADLFPDDLDDVAERMDRARSESRADCVRTGPSLRSLASL